MKVTWLRLARLDIEEIQSYYAEVAGKNTADNIIRKVVKASAMLSHHPHIGRISSLDSSGETLEWVIPNTDYILPYSIIGDKILIYRVFDTRQRMPSDWR